jgi:[ribosomal protein S5]-alanine N-acetyltransferase
LADTGAADTRLVLPSTIETDRLLLRMPRVDDADHLFQILDSDPEVMRYLSWRPGADSGATADFLATCLESWKTGYRFTWVVTVATSDEPVGIVDARIERPRAELGYVLGRAAWGRGYMTEAVRALVGLLLAQPDIYRVWAYTDVDNRASARVLEKAGLTREARLRRYAIQPNISAEPRDVHLYARTR